MPKPRKPKTTRRLDEMLSAWNAETLAKAAESGRQATERPTDEDIIDQCERMASRGYLPHFPEVYRQLAEFMAWSRIKTNRGLVLWGKCGTGKTHWLEAFAPTSAIYPAKKLVDVYSQRRVDFETIAYPPYYDSVPRNHYNLGIDDLGVEDTLVDFGTRVDVLSDLLQVRYALFKRRDARTFITTNLSPDEIEKRYGTRIISRLYEMCTFIHFKGSDLRRS